jgi:hypothetical protein
MIWVHRLKWRCGCLIFAAVVLVAQSGVVSRTASALPDDREWEMVSPPQKNGGLILESTETRYTTHASVHGDAVAYVATKPFEADSQGFDGWAWELSSRGSVGWSSKDISPAYDQPTSTKGRGAYEFPAFSEDLARAVLLPPEGVNERVPYLRTDYFNGDVSEVCVGECFEPLVWSGNVPAGTQFSGHIEVKGASGDARHVLLFSTVALTSQPLEPEGALSAGLYAWSAGALTLVSVLPASEGGVEALPSRGFMSADGSRVAWQTLKEQHLYLTDMSDLAKVETLRLDANQGGQGGGLPGAMFAGADASWSRLLFTDFEQLTPDSTAIDTTIYEPDLYVYDLNRPLGRRLTDLSVDPHAGEHANVREAFGAFDAGTNVYYVARGALAAGAVGGQGNVYVAHYNGSAWEKPALVTILPSDASRTTMSSDGRYLLFSSFQKLTGYDNHDASTGLLDPEIYMYEIQAHRLVCASCNPSGAPPGAGASVPPAGRFVLDDGRVFFQSAEALVLGDINGQSDVYEFEPAGVGDCMNGGATFSASAGGCVSLISTGTGAEGASFLEASQTGEDVFVLTSEKVLAQDHDTSLDVYDVHACSESAPCFPPVSVSPPECSAGDSCKGAALPQPLV